jgi:hypothetical protein
MLTMVLAAIWLAMLAARGTPLGVSMRRWLVEKPAASLSRIRWETVLTLALLCLFGGAAFLILGHEGVQLFGMAAPELAGLLAMIDLGVVVDVALVAIAAASTGGWRAVRAMFGVRVQRPRALRARRTARPARPAANDDEDGAALRAA